MKRNSVAKITRRLHMGEGQVSVDPDPWRRGQELPQKKGEKVA